MNPNTGFTVYENGKSIPFPHGLDDCVSIGFIRQVIQRDEVHLVYPFLERPLGV